MTEETSAVTAQLLLEEQSGALLDPGSSPRRSPRSTIKKRKSSDGSSKENCENVETYATVLAGTDKSVAENVVDVVSKKARTKAAPTVDNSGAGVSVPSLAALKQRSALPRYQNSSSLPQRSQSAAGAIAKVHAVAAEKKRAVIEQGSNERNAASVNSKSAHTPNKAGSSNIINRQEPTTPGTTNNLTVRRLQKILLQTNTFDRIRTIVDSAYSFNEEKLSSILSALKTKSTSKWDVKEKCKKQETVLKEMRDGVTLMFSESKQLKDRLVAYETDINMLISSTNFEIQDAIQNLTNARSTESRFKQEMTKMADDLRAFKEMNIELKKEMVTVKDANASLAAKAKDQGEKAAHEEKLRGKFEEELCAVKRDSAETLRSQQKESSDALKILKEESEAKLEANRAEINDLKFELGKMASDADRSVQITADFDRRASELKDELLKAQTKLQEREASYSQVQREGEKAVFELDLLKQQVAAKDAELKAGVAALHDMQLRVAEEKGGFKAELSAVQSRVAALEEERVSISSQLATKKEELASSLIEITLLKEQIANIEVKLTNKENEVMAAKEASMQLEMERELRVRGELREEAERTERIAACAQLLATQNDCNRRVRDIEEGSKAHFAELSAQVAAMASLRDQAVEQSQDKGDAIIALQSEVEQLRMALQNASTQLSSNHEDIEKIGKLSGELEILRRRVRETSETKTLELEVKLAKIHELEEQLKAGEVQRRKLHNVVQELRGNVRVFARLRPFLPSDGLALENLPEPTMDVRPDGTSVKICRQGSATERAEEFNFSFDRVFGQSCGQETIFQEVSEFVQSALDGYNVCLFSYGQTGSGKTHTMQGSGSGSMRGIIPRAMQQVGMYKTALEGKGWTYHMEVSFIEIYNETIRDLLRASQNEELKHEIKKDAEGNSFVSDVTMICIDPNNSEQVESIMTQAARYRSVGHTAMNERSSRSHSIFALHLRATNAAQGVTLKGTLSLVDLAGSERLDRSGVTGDRLKESVAINKSLSSLTDVFVAIGNKQSHIPFRNSKLTYLLQPALSGDGKTLMLVNLSPTEESYFESLCSLRLAAQINQCELGKPKKNLKDAPATTPQSSKEGAGSAASSQQKAAAQSALAMPTAAAMAKKSAAKK